MSAFDAYVQAKFHGGVMAGGPTFTVVHDAETPLRAGYADSITEYFRVGPTAGTSAHAMVDPVKAIKLLPDNVVAYAAGPYANTFGWHLEQAGYAWFTRADWTTADGMAQMHRVAPCIREVHDTWGIPKRWCTDDQLRRAATGNRASGGMTTHQQVARVLGGTTHTDPETNYPRDLLLEIVLNGSPSEEDVMNAAQEAKLDRVLTALEEGGGSTGRNNFSWLADQLRPELKEIRDAVIGGNSGGRNNFHWLAEQVVAAIGSIPGSEVHVVEQAIAKAVADEIDRRERDGDPATGPRS